VEYTVRVIEVNTGALCLITLYQLCNYCICHSAAESWTHQGASLCITPQLPACHYWLALL